MVHGRVVHLALFHRPSKKLLNITESDLGCFWPKSVDLVGDVSLDVLPRKTPDVRGHPIASEEQAEPLCGVAVALDRLGGFVGGAER
jgi:hypothetical protein